MSKEKNGAGAKPDKTGSNKPRTAERVEPVETSSTEQTGTEQTGADRAEPEQVEPEQVESTAVEPGQPDDDAPVPVPDTGPAEAPAEPPSGWRRVGQLLRPRGTRSELLTGLLCLALGFALAVQVGQSTGDQLSSLRQDELVRLLDEVTQRADQLDAEVGDLEAIRDDLQSEDGRDQAARDLAQQRAEQEGILSGRLPAQGPGVQIRVTDGAKPLEAQALFNLLEELRNAGAEAIQVNGKRLVTTSYFVDSGGGVVLDGAAIASPYEWTAIGDPDTIDRALEIPGGALPRIREEGGEATTTRSGQVEVDAVRIPGEPEHAEPVEPDTGK
ncbi:DUF881 domain-containing protein [Promicromonospora kroppenstedtii]|uniref:DUF881 domain-containing protein n=1 Tax=Promicromonospora kroppenstedtii TaxID=440482 RepID=UPI0004ACF02F|nr:DUF881 domain-containing protein [Promicromonospora kroppenstedtii]